MYSEVDESDNSASNQDDISYEQPACDDMTFDQPITNLQVCKYKCQLHIA